MSLTISRVLHAGYLFESDQTRLLFDPVFENPFSRNCYAYPDLKFDLEVIKKQSFDAIFISHYHDDHCSFESLQWLDRQTPLYVYCLHEELFEMLRDLGFKNIFPLKLGEVVKAGPFQVTPLRAFDKDVDSLFHVQVAGLNILNVVDSWIDDDQLASLARTTWDLILWPFQTMQEWSVLCPLRALPPSREIPAEYLQQLQLLNPRYVVPSACQFIHETWSWYRKRFFPISYDNFESTLATVLPQAQLVRMNPLSSWRFEEKVLRPLGTLSWGTVLDPQDVDYEFEEDVEIPSTSEVAQHFPLASEKVAAVLDFCQRELPRRYEELGPAPDAYFAKPRLWRLDLFESRGAVHSFSFILEGSKMRGTEQTAPLEWLTEIPIARLYGAIEEGESLSSLYIRINNQRFSKEVEESLAEVELTEDPLLRCLYNGRFGSYQKSQLQKILKDSR